MHSRTELTGLGLGMATGNWDEIRTAYEVARLGTVSAAAEVLGIHHTTVIRQVDALEKRLEVKLFQRHPRGYQATESGEELLKVAKVTDDQLTQMVGRIRGRSNQITGDMVITTVAGSGAVILPALARLQVEHPELRVKLLSDDRLFRLEYGEAHVAIRAGMQPQEPDNIVQSLGSISPDLVASKGYVKRNGIPNSTAELSEHRFVGPHEEFPRAPPMKWMRANVPPENIVISASDPSVGVAAVRAGIGIGFIWSPDGLSGGDLVQVMPRQKEWAAPLWLVTHVDLHRTPKVQAILKMVKQAVQEWQS